jgi:hypothetical protein
MDCQGCPDSREKRACRDCLAAMDLLELMFEWNWGEMLNFLQLF